MAYTCAQIDSTYHRKEISFMNHRKACLAALLASAFPFLANAQSTTVDFGTTYQTIRGFGGSTAWMPTMPSAEVNALYGTGQNELGLSILRVRIDPGGSSNWSAELGSAQEAQTLGASIIATPWTPPASMKSNNSTVMGSLNTSSYAAYAAYLESFVNYMANGGVNLYAISMQNEPDANVTYESCVWTGQQMDTWTAQNASVLTTKLMMPESESFTTSYSDPTLNDSSAVGYVGIVAGHLYGVSPTYYTNAKNKGKELWMTEHYLNPSGSQPAIGDAISAAEEIHNSLVTAQYNAYLWWWVADWNPGSSVTNTGLVDTSNNPTYFGYALGQYSRFVRPGSVRVSATATPSSGVYVSAYKGSSSSAIVAINSNTSSVSLPVTMQNMTASSVTPYQTTSSGGLAQQSAVTISSNAFTYTLPAQSIVTFVIPTSSASCTTVPSAPVGVTATAASSSSINLSWGAVTAPSNCSISSYAIYRSTSSGFTPSAANQVGSVTSGTTFADTGLSPSTTYYYVVKANDGAGASAASTQASATTSAAPAGFACHVTYTISNQWSGGFGAAISISNTGSTAISNWTLTWSFANGQTITQAWNGTATQSGSNVSITNMSYNGSIAAGSTYTGLGFNGSWNNVTNSVPASFAVNGTTCQ
jgi:glucuronoarabinoxylan endo-1,4-beta-xylanase